MNLLHPAPGFAFGSPFGDRPDPFDPTKRNFHNGVDIKTPAGTPLQAPSDGRVRFAGFLPSSPSSGLALGVDAPDGHTFWSFAHLSEVFVGVGENVKAGTIIARSGATGVRADGSSSVTGPHLHFVVSIDHNNVDPVPLLAGSSGGVVALGALGLFGRYVLWPLLKGRFGR